MYIYIHDRLYDIVGETFPRRALTNKTSSDPDVEEQREVYMYERILLGEGWEGAPRPAVSFPSYEKL